MARFRNIDISIILDGIKNSPAHFDKLKSIEPIVDSDSLPYYFVGASAIVVKARYKGGCYALKCYDFYDDERKRSLHTINSFFKKIDSKYIAVGELLTDEFTVTNHDGKSYVLPVEISPWIEGATVGSLLDSAIYFGDRESISTLLDKLLELAMWLIDQEFAHGDIKSDNIIVGKDGSIALIDLNNAYIPGFYSSPLFELGTEGFRHPSLNDRYYNKRLDDYPLLILITTLLAAERSIEFFHNNYSGEFILFDTAKLAKGRCENYERVKELFSNTIIEKKMISLLESRSPSVENLRFWIEALSQKRKGAKRSGCNTFLSETTMKHGVLDKSGEIAFPAIFDDAAIDHNNCFVVEFEGKWGVIDCDHKLVVPLIWEYISREREQRIIIKSEGKFAYFDMDYNQITPFAFDKANLFHEGCAVVSVNGKYGYIDRSGRFLIEPLYDFAYNIKNSIAIVRKGDDKREIKITDLIENNDN